MAEPANPANDAEIPAWDRAPAEPRVRARPSQSSWWWFVKIFAIFAVCVAVGGQLVWLVYSSLFPPHVIANLREVAGAEARAAVEHASPSPSPPSPRTIDTDLAVRRSRLVRAEADVQAAYQLISKVREQQVKWDSFVPDLLASDSKLGRKMAADTDAAQLLLGALDGDRIKAAELERLQAFLRTLAVPIQAATEDESAVLDMSAEFTAELSGILERLQSGLKRWQEDYALVQVLIKEAEERPESDQTLADAIDTLRADETRRRAERVEEEVAAAKVVLDKKTAASRIRLHELDVQLRLEAEKLEAQRKEAKVAGLKIEQKVLGEQIKAQLRRADLERRYQADLPEIRRVLTAFITPGHQQIVEGKWRRVEEKQPVSLGGLRAINALGDGETSERNLYYAAGTNKNDRPGGPFHYHNGRRLRDHETAVAQRARRLLLEYGDLMVEKKMLTP